MSSAAPFRSSAASACASPATVSCVPMAISVGARYLADFGRRQRLPRAADTGGERLEVALVLVGEGAEHALHRVAQRLQRRRLHRVGDAERQPDALDQMMAEAAQDQPAHPRRMLPREEGGDPGAHGIAHHVGAVDGEMVEQIGRVRRHPVRRVSLRVVQLLARSVAAVVDQDRAPSRLGQRRRPARRDPVDAVRRGEAVDQQDRLAEVEAVGRHVAIGQRHAVGEESLHRTSLLPVGARFANRHRAA